MEINYDTESQEWVATFPDHPEIGKSYGDTRRQAEAAANEALRVWSLHNRKATTVAAHAAAEAHAKAAADADANDHADAYADALADALADAYAAALIYIDALADAYAAALIYIDALADAYAADRRQGEEHGHRSNQ